MFSYFVLFNLYFVSIFFHFKTFKRINLMDFEKTYILLPLRKVRLFRLKKKKKEKLKYFSIQIKNPRNKLLSLNNQLK